MFFDRTDYMASRSNERLQSVWGILLRESSITGNHWDLAIVMVEGSSVWSECSPAEAWDDYPRQEERRLTLRWEGPAINHQGSSGVLCIVQNAGLQIRFTFDRSSGNILAKFWPNYASRPYMFKFSKFEFLICQICRTCQALQITWPDIGCKRVLLL